MQSTQSCAEDSQALALSSELACWDVPDPEEFFEISDAVSLMRAIVSGATRKGQYYADPSLVRYRLVWWQTDLDKEAVAVWLSELQEYGEITVERSARNCYGGWHDVLTITNLRRFKRWRPRRQISQAIRDAVYARDAHTCRACGRKEDLSVDHIIPITRGGEDSMTNYQTLCRPCNSRKGARL